jgi:hypothetical protein
MSLLSFASQSLAAVFVATLAFGSAPASADEGPLLRRPVHHHHHFQRHVILPVVQHVPTCYGCGVHVVQPVCGCSHAYFHPYATRWHYQGLFGHRHASIW